MAIGIVQSKKAQEQFPFSTSVQTNDLTSTPTSGNLLIAFMYFYQVGAGHVTPPTGWTALKEGDCGGDGVAGVYYRIAGASEPSHWTWTSSDSINGLFWDMIELSGIDTSTPIDVAATAYETASFDNSNYNVSAITTVTNGAWDFAILQARNGSSFSIISPAGYTEWDDFNDEGIYYKEITSAGSTDTRVLKNSGFTNRIGYSFAVRPAGGGGGGTTTVHRLTSQGVGA